MVSTMPTVPEDYIFVFGSNDVGRHGAGAALWALRNKGAIYGQGQGFQGQSYGIVTKKQVSAFNRGLISLSLSEIEKNVEIFFRDVESHRDKKFYVTRIGCGLAGYKDSQIAPLFVNAIKAYAELVLIPENSSDHIVFDPAWESYGLPVLKAKISSTESAVQTEKE
jgi:hypothetical protein